MMMLDLEKIKRDGRADRQEQEFAKSQRDYGFIATRVNAQIDVEIKKPGGNILLVDCKFSDKPEFYIERTDIDKGLNEVIKYKALGFDNTSFAVDMWFPRFRKLGNRKLIAFDESCRGRTFKADFTGKTMVLTLV